jgi:hypothetical protein
MTSRFTKPLFQRTNRYANRLLRLPRPALSVAVSPTDAYRSVTAIDTVLRGHVGRRWLRVTRPAAPSAAATATAATIVAAATTTADRPGMTITLKPAFADADAAVAQRAAVTSCSSRASCGLCAAATADGNRNRAICGPSPAAIRQATAGPAAGAAASTALASASTRHHDAIRQCVAALADIARATATTTRFVQLGARTTTVEPTMPPPPALARATDSDHQLLAPRDRDSCAHLTAASADALAASTARRPHSVYVDAPRTFRHPEVLFAVADILEAALTLARCVVQSNCRRNALSPSALARAGGVIRGRCRAAAAAREYRSGSANA